MSLLARNTFRDDGYEDGKAGKRPSPPRLLGGSDVMKIEYMEGWEQGNHEYALEQSRGLHGQD